MRKLLRFLDTLALLVPLFFGLFTSCAFGQRPPGQLGGHQRYLLVVPLTGSGNHDDPRRPLVMPAKSAESAAILSYRYIVSDDGKLAILEIVPADDQALQGLLIGYEPLVQIFSPKTNAKDDIEKEIRKIRKDFDLDNFLAPVIKSSGKH